MKEWFAGLEPRERIMVSVAAGFIVFAVYWFAVWQPLARGEADLQARIDSWQTSIAELAPLRGRLGSGQSSAPVAGANQSLVVIVDNTLRARGLYGALQRSQPTTGNGIRVEFDNVAFDELVQWLGELGARYGLNVQNASFSQNSSNAAGRVNASLTLERS